MLRSEPYDSKGRGANGDPLRALTENPPSEMDRYSVVGPPTHERVVCPIPA